MFDLAPLLGQEALHGVDFGDLRVELLKIHRKRQGTRNGTGFKNGRRYRGQRTSLVAKDSAYAMVARTEELGPTAPQKQANKAVVIRATRVVPRVHRSQICGQFAALDEPSGAGAEGFCSGSGTIGKEY